MCSSKLFVKTHFVESHKLDEDYEMKKLWSLCYVTRVNQWNDEEDDCCFGSLL